MNTHTEGQDLLGCTLIVIAMLAVTQGHPDYPSAIVVAGVTLVSLACFGYLARGLKSR